ncbi:hypothetical protein WJX72_009132 [[Myrmecia] bisecta]|uniref:Cat eye syndrome critical region protein 5 n=1 Tax=[Myrmecia] bisecta TaxID=41462 RepID=A0AAW1R8B5_9CHLO
MRRVTQLLPLLRAFQPGVCQIRCAELLPASSQHSQPCTALHTAEVAATADRSSAYQPASTCSAINCQGQRHMRPDRRHLFTEAAAGPPAFVFDIDGVLIRGKRVLDAAKTAMAKLYKTGGETLRFPVCFLTNGGGVTEARKAAQLSDWLDVAVSPQQVVLSHTPFRQLAPRLGHQPVLIIGHGDIAHVAKEYGFHKAVTTDELAVALGSSALPFHRGSQAEPKHVPRVLGKDGFGSEAQPFAAVLVFKDPVDWYQDLQLATDVILSGGVPLRSRPVGNHTVEVVFSNPDLVWANDHPVSRLGQGAFATCLEALHQQLAGKSLQRVKYFGKPNPEPYELIQKLLMQQAHELGYVSSQETGSLPFGGIFMVGDNPKADVRGARLRGPPWVPILVRTGVFQGPEANDPEDPADIVVDDVAAAVDAALHRSRNSKWHSLR